MSRAAVVVLAAALLAVVGAGCGGGGSGSLSNKDYQSEMRALAVELRSTADSSGVLDVGPAEPEPIPPSASVRESLENAIGRVVAVEGANADGLEIIADLFQHVADGLGEIEPPEDVALAHENLAAVARNAATELRSLADKVREDSVWRGF